MNTLKQMLSSTETDKNIVPVIPIIGQYAAMRARQSMKNIVWNAELMSNVVLSSLQRHRYDICNPITDPSIGVESTGSHIRIHDWISPEITSFAVDSKFDISLLPVLDPYTSGRMPVVIECEQMLNEKVGNDTCVSGMISGVLTFAAFLRGPQFIFYDVSDHPDFLHDLLKYSLDNLSRYAEAQVITGGVNIIQIFDPSAKLIEENDFEEFSLTYLRELIHLIKSLGASVMLHTCEGSISMLNTYIDMGVDILNVNGNVDLSTAKTIINNRAILAGNITSDNLVNLNPQEIFSEACRCIEKAAEGGNYILGTSCEVPINTREENIDSLVRAAHEFGPDYLNYSLNKNIL